MRKSLAVLVAVGVFGTLSASAATLGGLNSATLGADQTIVASCDTDGVDISYVNSYKDADNTFYTDAVVLSDVSDTCAGSEFEVVLSDGTSSLASVKGDVTLQAGAQTVVLDAPVKAADVKAASLVIAN